jgi:two-component system NtrC family sensor kinase
MSTNVYCYDGLPPILASTWRFVQVLHTKHLKSAILMFPSKKKATILVVESCQILCSSTARVIKTLGYDAVTADNGDSCKEILNSSKINVLILDINIEGKSGAAVLPYVHDHFPDLPVIITSSSMSEKEEAESFAAEAFEYLIKPVNPKRLEITIKKAITESERRQEASLFSIVVTNSPIAIVITDKEGSIEFANNAFCRTTGYSLSEVIGQNPRILKSGEQPDSYYKDLWDTIKSGKNWQGEFHNKKKNGELYWENSVIIPIIDPTWAISHFISIKQDISLRKKELEAFSESERRFQELADLLPQTVFEVDVEGWITYTNRVGFDTFGYSLEDLHKGVHSLLLFAPEERERVKLNMERRVKDIPFDNHEYTGVRKDGTSFPILVYTARIIRDGRPVGVRGIVLDISARKQIEETLQQLNQTLEERIEERTKKLESTHQQMILHEKLASIGLLASGIAHELNNPINFVKINFTTLKEAVSDFQEMLKEYQKVIRKFEKGICTDQELQAMCQMEAALDINTLFNDISEIFIESQRGFDRITAIIASMRNFSFRHAVDERVQFDINHGIQDALTIARNEYRNYAEIETLFDELPLISCNPEQINQVFLNLIVNSAHAIASLGRSSLGKIIIHTWCDSSNVYCSIADDGPGIPQEVRNRIFDPFFTTKEPGKGTGLGLSISYDIIVNKHGGTLSVDCPAENGSVFTISLPLTVEQAGI